MEFIKYYYSIFSIDVTSQLNLAIWKSSISLPQKRILGLYTNETRSI